MASLEGFETTLKEVLHAKRLSASRMDKLTEMALSLMEQDTQLVSVMYRTHKSSSAASKIHSLYAFDALSRAARNQVVKQKLDVHAIVGNCATFLIKVEGVLDGLFQDILSSGHPEAKEKTKKILDIWLKSNTFPSAVLTRLHKLVKETEKEKEPDKATAVTADPRIHTAPSANHTPQVTAAATSTAVPEVSPGSVQSALLALLSQAANAAATSQIVPNNASVDPQLALFQQLKQATNAGGPAAALAPNQHVTVPMSVVPSSAPANIPPVASSVGGPSRNYPYRDDRSGLTRSEPYHDRFNGPPRGRDFYDNREPRGGFRGGPRGRGRGRWDDRDRQYDRNRGNSNDWRPPPPHRTQPSRSRSPVARRNVRPYSPPNRRTSHPGASSPPRLVPPANPHDSGKDEFGRDIRQRSPHEDTSAPPSYTTGQSPSRSASIPSEDRGSAHPEKRQHDTSLNTQPIPSSIPASTSTSIPEAAAGLDSFDLTAFDPTAAASWEALGKAWNVTNGYMPSQEELMQYMLSMSTPNTFPIMSYEEDQTAQWSDRQEAGWGQGTPRRGGRGHRGSFGHGHEYGNGRGDFRERGQGRGFDHDTDALTLVGGDESISYTEPISDHTQAQPQHDMIPGGYEEAGPGPFTKGGMQKVGDGWVWSGAGIA
ncbi:hypothetical protein BDW22DRAFT_1361205 [Trametopsis cervina]|nr:hypothetical protein BDW22DRAFT_1361205 [Trametopsis cervina]